MKRRWLWAALPALVLIAGTSLWLLRAPEPIRLVLSHPWNQATDVQALSQVLAKFHSLYPNLTVVAPPAGAGLEAADVVASSRFTEAERSLLLPALVPWTGNLWLLAARTEALDAAAHDLPAPVAALREGRATPQDLRDVLAWTKGHGWTPLTLGNSHGWPYLLWGQHWAAATVGPDAVAVLPKTYEKVRAAFDELADWKKKGWFADVWSQGWAQGLVPLDQGKAAFALVSEGNFGTIQAKTLGHLEFLAFPHAAGSPAWSIGSAVYLGIRAASTHPQEAQLLARYLTSPGVAQELTRLTTKPFFAWKTEGTPAQVLPSWADAAMTAPYNALAAAFTLP